MKTIENSAESTQTLLDAAVKARKQAYTPYSKFAVGAAVLTASGDMFTGCNIENASYGATMCAERVAVSKAISAGHKSIKALAIVADHPEPIAPCGICRQVMAEFGQDAVVLMANTKGQIKTMSVQELLPIAFMMPARDISP